MKVYLNIIFLVLISCFMLHSQTSYKVGRVLNTRGFPMENTQVILKSYQSKAISDRNGAFLLRVPSNRQIQPTDITIISSVSNSSNFEVYIEGSNMEIIIDVPMYPVKSISVFGIGGSTLRNIDVFAEGNTYTTNRNGDAIVTDSKVKNESKFMIDGEEVKVRSFNYQTYHMTLFIDKEADSLVLNVVDELTLKKAILDKKRTAIKNEIKDLEALLNKKDLTPEERQKIIQKIRFLKEELNEVIKEQKDIENEAFNKLKQLELVAANRLKELQKEKEAKRQAELARQQSEFRQRMNFVIFMLIAIFLVIMTLFLEDDKRSKKMKLRLKIRKLKQRM